VDCYGREEEVLKVKCSGNPALYAKKAFNHCVSMLTTGSGRLVCGRRNPDTQRVDSISTFSLPKLVSWFDLQGFLDAASLGRGAKGCAKFGAQRASKWVAVRDKTSIEAHLVGAKPACAEG
jgi:hypothetical protein